MKKTTFALYFGNRGFFPGELIASARDEMTKTLEKAGFGYIISDEKATRYGAVETLEEGEFYNNFLKKHEGEYDGIIICLPNFGDENGAYAALKDADVPILVQAYPDEVGKMDFCAPPRRALRKNRNVQCFKAGWHKIHAHVQNRRFTVR